jgi:hypothetical protein
MAGNSLGSRKQIVKHHLLAKESGILLASCKGEDRRQVAAQRDHQLPTVRNKLDAAD